MISVIIPTYNEERNIERCLRSLEKQTIPRSQFEVIVVDGQSKDRTVEIAGRYADRVIQQVSKGVGGARNDGAKIARGEIIATTDADCVPCGEWLESAQGDFDDRDVVAVTGFLVPFDLEGMSRAEAAVYKLMFDASNTLLSFLAKLGFYHLCGANSAFRRDTFFEIEGYLDLAYSDDVEVFKRIRKKGKTVLERRMRINYSVRRIKKIGLMKYIFLIIKNDFQTMVLGLKPVKGNYSKQDYN